MSTPPFKQHNSVPLIISLVVGGLLLVSFLIASLAFVFWGLTRTPSPTRNADTSVSTASPNPTTVPAVVVPEPIKAEEPYPRLVAVAGFNVATGLGTGKPSLYRIGSTLPKKGEGNPDFGWADGWDGAADSVVIDKDAAFEGDAGARVTPHGGELYLVRSLRTPLKGKIQIEQSIRGDDGIAIISRPGMGQENCAPMWGISNGQFWAFDGTGDGQRTDTMHKRTGIMVKPKTWYTVTLTIDMDAKGYEFSVNGQKFKTDHLLGFRGDPHAIGSIDFLATTPFDLDAIKVTQLSKPEK